MSLLVIDACVRGDASATRQYYKAFLEKSGIDDIHVLELDKLGLKPLDNENLMIREELCKKRDFDHPLLLLANMFKDADEILIAAPYWDLSFPSMLKVYLEHIMVSGLTFGYDNDGKCVGYCKARRLLYFSTCGGYVEGEHLGYEYVRALAGMLGINETHAYVAEGLDINPEKRDEALKRSIEEMLGK